MTKLSEDNIADYFKLIIVFLGLTVLGVGLFFYSVSKDIDENAEDKISKEIETQSYHFRSVLDIQYRYLEGIADHIGQSDELLSEDNRAILSSIYETENFNRVSIIEPDGTAHYDNGETTNVSERRYYKEAISGKRTLSDPLQSKVDGEIRVVLGVPIYENGDSNKKIIGILGGSYDVTSLSQMFFNDFYDGIGYFIMAKSDGTIVFENGMSSDQENTDNLFDYCKEKTFYNNTTLDEMRKGFQRQTNGQVQFKDNEQKSYLIYAPLEMNQWMIGYCIPVTKAQEEYNFISRYELFLSIYFAIVVVLLLLLVIHKHNKIQSSLLKFARTDALTGIRNKKNTEDEINQWLGSQNEQDIQAFVMFDIDKFKEINDGYGHVIGDEVLYQIGNVLQKHFRKDDILGRIGGDEFVILMKSINSYEDAIDRTKILSEQMNKIMIKSHPEITITCSIGLSFYPIDGKNYHELYQCADQALYKTKERGRNGYTVYEKKKA
jgi:diguanylate cyclase (GGDEF)-like protein